MTPTDSDLDDMHHALGRPDGPHVEPYRNRYCCAAGGDQARRFEALGLWRLAAKINQGRDALYEVTPEGRCLVMAWLVERQRKEGLRPWVVHGGGLTARTIVAKSAAAARYTVFLALSDVWSCSFREFLAMGVRARPA